jgi:hypothetical protein
VLPGAAQLVDTQRGSWIPKYWPNTVGTKVLVGGKNVGIQRRSKAEPTARGKLYRVSTTFLRPLKCDLRRFLARRHIIASLALALFAHITLSVSDLTAKSDSLNAVYSEGRPQEDVVSTLNTALLAMA